MRKRSIVFLNFDHKNSVAMVQNSVIIVCFVVIVGFSLVFVLFLLFFCIVSEK